jgi:phosphoserine phosphatase
MAGFEKNFGNRLGMAPDSLTGEVLLPIVDKDFKKRQLEEECRQLGISPALAVATGDGANDIPMLQAAGAGVGYYAKPAVVAATPFQIRHTDLSAILYLQGYRRAQFAL